MRKLGLMLIAAILAVMAVVPASAQDRPDIPTLLTEDGSFTTLLVAVDAAGLGETLAGEGPFTVFAPTDDAFAATLEALGLTADDVLADTDLLTEILTYHVVPERNFLRTLIGGAQLETVQGGTLNVYRSATGQLTVNGVPVSRADQIASNGVVFFIDGVLLPAGALPTAYVRLAHLSPDAGPVDIYVNGANDNMTAINFGTISDFVAVPAGYIDVQVAPAGTAADDASQEAAIAAGPIFLAPNSYTTVAAIGSAEAGTLTGQVINEDFSNVGDQSQVRVFHALEGAPTVDVLANGAVLIAELGFPGTLSGDDGTENGNDGLFTANVAPGEYDLAVVETGTTEPALLSADDVALEAGIAYLIVAGGTPDDPQLFLASFDTANVVVTATEEAPVATAEATGEATAEAPAATSVPTAEPTMEMTPDTTPEVTPDATPDVTPEVTPEGTPGS